MLNFGASKPRVKGGPPPGSAPEISPERVVLDLESEVVRGLVSIPTKGNIFF